MKRTISKLVVSKHKNHNKYLLNSLINSGQEKNPNKMKFSNEGQLRKRQQDFKYIQKIPKKLSV